MTKAEYIELCLEKWDKIEAVSKVDNLYELEKDFRLHWEVLGRDVLERGLGDLPKDYRKKKV